MSRHTLSVLFIELVQSTAVMTRMRPAEADVVRQEHVALLREAVAKHAGRVIKHLGDGVMCVFDNASDALTCSIAMQQMVAERTSGPGAFAGMRVGISIGEVTVEEGDCHGTAVIEAARLCRLARLGQILAGRAVRLVAGRVEGVAVVEVGPQSFRGLPHPIDVDEVLWTPTMNRALRLLLVDDAALIREGLARLLEDEGFAVVGQAADASDLAVLVDELRPDVVITDVRMPPTFTLEGLHAALQIRAAFPDVAVLVLSQHLETRYAEELLAPHARGVGYLLKDRVAATDEFASAIRRIASGGTAVDPSMVELLIARSQREGDLDELTPRESEILSFVAEGLSNAGIARRLTLGTRTVESHVSSILSKLGLAPDLGADRRVLAAIQYLRGR